MIENIKQYYTIECYENCFKWMLYCIKYPYKIIVYIYIFIYIYIQYDIKIYYS